MCSLVPFPFLLRWWSRVLSSHLIRLAAANNSSLNLTAYCRGEEADRNRLRQDTWSILIIYDVKMVYKPSTSTCSFMQLLPKLLLLFCFLETHNLRLNVTLYDIIMSKVGCTHRRRVVHSFVRQQVSKLTLEGSKAPEETWVKKKEIETMKKKYFRIVTASLEPTAVDSFLS